MSKLHFLSSRCSLFLYIDFLIRYNYWAVFLILASISCCHGSKPLKIQTFKTFRDQCNAHFLGTTPLIPPETHSITNPHQDPPLRNATFLPTSRPKAFCSPLLGMCCCPLKLPSFPTYFHLNYTSSLIHTQIYRT